VATKTFYVLATTGTSPDWCGSLQEGGSAPTGANSLYGWQVAKTAANNFFRGRLGATGMSATTQGTSFLDSQTGPQLGTGSGNTTASDFFNSPVAYTGTFAAGNWTFAWNFRSSAATHSGQIRMRVWASTSDTGASARELTSATQAGTIITLNSTTADFNSSITWNAPSITLNNEFLFFEVEWKVTTQGTSNSCSSLFRIGTSSITTTDLQQISAGAGSAAGVGATSVVVNCIKESAANAAGAGDSAVEGGGITGATASATGAGASSVGSGIVIAATGAASGIGAAAGVPPGLAAITGALATCEDWPPQRPIFLLHCDGANASTSFPDSVGGHTVTSIGAAQIDTSQSVFGGASAKFQGPLDYLQLDGAADLAIGTGDFQFDCRTRFSAYDNYELIDWGGSGPTLKIGTDGKLVYQIGGVDKINGSTVLAVDTFYHVAVSRAAGTTRIWLDGTQEGSDYVASDNITISANRPTIGTRS